MQLPADGVPASGCPVERIDGNESRRIGIMGRQQRFARFCLGITVFQDIALADDGVVFAVGHGADAGELSRPEPAGSDIVVVECLGGDGRSVQNANQHCKEIDSHNRLEFWNICFIPFGPLFGGRNVSGNDCPSKYWITR